MKNKLIFILLFALSSFFGCSSKEPEKKTTSLEKASVVGKSDNAANLSTPEKAVSVDKMVFKGPGKLLPREFGDWALSSSPRYFGPDNLYDLIDGGAEIYVQFGLKNMVTADYARQSQKGVSITAEIYDMDTALGAFGRTARFLEGLEDPSVAAKGLKAPFADKSVFGDGDLVTWKDKYLLHLTLMDESPSATRESIASLGAEVLPRLASTILESIPGDSPLPEIFGRFPNENRVARSESFYPSGLLGIDELQSGFSVRYSLDGATWLLFSTDELEGENAMQSAWKAVKATEVQGRSIAVRTAGKRIVGLVQDGDKPLDEKIIAKLVKDFAVTVESD